MGQMTSTALKNSSGTLLLQLAVPPLPVERLGWLPKLANPHATGHERSNQPGEKPDLPQRKPGSPRENCWLPTASQLHGFLPRSYNEILRVARLGWFPRTNWPLYGAGPRPRKICQPWNVKFCQSETGWLFGQIKRSFNPGFCGSSNFPWILPWPWDCQPSKQSVCHSNPGRATAGFGCTQNLASASWQTCRSNRWIRMSTIYKLQVSFLFTESHILSLGLKCTDRSRWSLSTVTSGHSRTSILGASTFVEYHAQLVFPSARYRP